MTTGRLKTFLLVSMVCILTIVVHYLSWLKPIEVFLRSIISPTSKVVYQWSVSINEEDETFDSIEQLQNAYAELKSKFVEQRIDVVALQSLQEENGELRELANFFTRHSYVYVGADVIGKNIDPVGSTLIINVGEAHGIQTGNPAITGNGVLVGRIWRVETDTAVIRLLDDNQSKFAATLLNKEKSIGVVEGGFGLSIRMNFIPQNEKVQIGDTIVTSGIEAGVPRGILIGTVEATERESHQPFQSAVVSPIKKLDTIRTVSIIIKDTM